MSDLCRTVNVTTHGSVASAVLQPAVGCTVDQVLAKPVATDEAGLPSFFVVGPPRTGSSWLYEVLRPHAGLPSHSKETRFFDTHFHRGLKWYLAHYERSGGEQRMGEVAPTYFASTAARERIALTVPRAKIVCVFRNPVERVISLYRVKRAYGWIPWSFAEAIQRDPELMESGRYASTLKLWQRSFGADNVMAGIYDDLWNDPQGFVDAIVDFVGLQRFSLADWQYGLVHDSERMTQPRSYYRTRTATIVANWFKARRLDHVVSAFRRSRFRRFVLGGGAPFPKVSSELLTQLQAGFLPEVEELEEMLHRGLSTWKVRDERLVMATTSE
jgi:Sulfotransferase domain